MLSCLSMPSVPTEARDFFRPTWRLLFFAFALAFTGFLIPQEMPLEWYPLNEPGDDLYHLEISCAADRAGDVQVFYNLTRGINPRHSAYFPIGPSEPTYTYRFPLPDAPIIEMRLDPVAAGGTLTIRQMRIVNRRGDEIRRFTHDMFRAGHEIAEIRPSPEGWQIVSTPEATDPQTRIELFSPIVPPGKDGRNVQRCLLSTSYLALMLWIALLAFRFTWRAPADTRLLAGQAGYLALLALLFAFVGNRGLIRDTWHYSRYMIPATLPGLRLEFDLVSTGPSPTQLFWDIGRGLIGEDSHRLAYEPHANLQMIRFQLPATPVSLLRYDPRDNPGGLRIRGIRVVDQGQRTLASIPLQELQPAHQVARLELVDGELWFESTPNADDPILAFSPRAVALINEAITTRR